MGINMRTCPTRLYHTNSQAEQLIFRQLKQSFNNQEGYVAMHSVLLTDHPNKRFAEIDFLLCTNIGLFVLEVKGGQVSCQSGIWHYQDKNGNQNTGGSPFRQADDAMQGLRWSLLKRFDRNFIDSICFGYGVILTDSNLPENTLEYDKPMLCQKGGHHHLQKWLTNLFNYWQNRNKKIMPNIKVLSNQELSSIVQFIRPDSKYHIDDKDASSHVKNNQLELFKINQDKIFSYGGENLEDGQIKDGQNSDKVVFNHCTMDDLMIKIKDFIFLYYEKMVEDTYFLAKDISIVVDDLKIEKEMLSMIGELKLNIKMVDDYSFNMRKSYELSLFRHHPSLRLKNKIIVAIFSKDSSEYGERIKNYATHMGQVFYY